MAALCLPTTLQAPCSSGAQRLRSSAARGAPLVARPPSAARGATNARERASVVRVAAFQLPGRKWWEAPAPPNVQHIASVQQLVDAMASAGDRLVIVDVFAPWCVACKGLYPKLLKLVEARPDVLLLTVNFDENKTLVRALGVKVLPFFLFYRGAEGKLGGFSASAKKIDLIKDAIERHSTPRCYLSSTDEEPVLPEFPNVVPSAKRAAAAAGGLADGKGAAGSSAAAAAAGKQPPPPPLAAAAQPVA